MAEYQVYMLECSDKSFYVGVTGNLQHRLLQHENGSYRSCYTYERRPVQLVFHALFTNIEDAIKFEKKLKKWRREKKVALINGDYEKLKKLR
jgi:putative endonuclease